MRISQYEPYIMFHLSCGERTRHLIFLNIANIGQGIAKDVSFEILKDPQLKDSDLISNSPFFSYGIKYFPPKKEYTHFLGSWNGLTTEDILSRQIEIKVTYKDIFGKKNEEIFSLSLSDTSVGAVFNPPESDIGMISYNLGKINDTLKRQVP